MTNATEKDAECIANSFESVEEWKSRKWLGVDGMFRLGIEILQPCTLS